MPDNTRDDVEDMRTYIEAGCSETGHDRLMELARHECSRIRSRVAENAAAPLALLMMLAKDDDVEVRVALCSNTSCDEALFTALMMDENPTVRFTLAEDANCPISVLSQLTEDENPYVCARAVRTIKRLSAAGLAGGYKLNTEQIPERKSRERRRRLG